MGSAGGGASQCVTLVLAGPAASGNERLDASTVPWSCHSLPSWSSTFPVLPYMSSGGADNGLVRISGLTSASGMVAVAFATLLPMGG